MVDLWSLPTPGTFRAMPEVLQIPIRGEKFALRVAVRETLADIQTEFQRVTIVDTETFGRALLLDGHIQFTDLDEAAYHESLVHMPMLSLQNPRRALVVGGGDGGVIRELCRHSSLEQIDIVEIDPGVIEACRTHLPHLSAGAYDDPRVHLYVQDAFPFVKEAAAGHYDLVVLDSTDTYEDEEGELSAMLFTGEFYADVARLLSPAGIAVTQGDNPLYCPYSLREIIKQFQGAFSRVGDYWTQVPSFGGFSAFCWASKGAEIAPTMPPHKLADLRYLNPERWQENLRPLPFSVDIAFRD